MKIETKRLNIRLAEISDASSIIHFYKRNHDHLSPWSPKQPNNFMDTEFWSERISKYKLEYSKQQSLKACLFTKSGELIGRCNFTNVERGSFQNCRLGYKLDHEYEGKGYMSEALDALIQVIFNEFKIHRIEANVIPSNTKSRKLLERLGFEEHGIAKSYLKIDGKWQDHVLTSLLSK
ncbi:GNAT family N-acetyltransferase [Halobacteriovorax sp.]|uniref:GNAT family N-acetyltransferase n=1 Tax=Halobacteriovorax sp. TaxID=2020862 RepID=UPI003566F35C